MLIAFHKSVILEQGRTDTLVYYGHRVYIIILNKMVMWPAMCEYCEIIMVTPDLAH